MIKSKEIFFKELANLSDLNNNFISLVFAKNPDIDISSKEKFFDNVKTLYQNQKNIERDIFKIESEEKIKDFNKFLGKDFRIKNIKLSSIRGFPKSVIPYGINFCNDIEEPQSMILLGANAVGKSSIYEAIEYTYTKTIGEANLRKIINNKEYLSHFNNDFSDCYCEIVTNNKDEIFNLKKDNLPEDIVKRINPDNHFISDFDIYYNGQLDYDSNIDKSFHYLIAKSLGLTELLEFEKDLKLFSTYKRQVENRSRKALNDENKILYNNTHDCQRDIGVKENQLLILKNNKDELLKEKDIKDTIELFQQIKQIKYSFIFNFDILIDQIFNYTEAYKEFISIKIKEGDLKVLQFLNMGLEIINEMEKCPFCENSNDNKENIINNVIYRIEKIKSINKILQKLHNNYEDVFKTLSELIFQINSILKEISNELTKIEGKTLYNNLLNIDIKLKTFLSDRLGKLFFMELNRLDYNSNFLNNNMTYIHEFFLNNNEYIEGSLQDDITILENYLNTRQEIIKEIENLLTTKSEGMTITEKIIVLNKELTDLNKQIENNSKTIQINSERIKIFDEQILLFNEIQDQVKKYLTYFHNRINEEVEQAFVPVKKIIEEILNYYFRKIDTRDIKIEVIQKPEIDKETGEIISEFISVIVIPDDETIPPLSISKYLNTFHYRLFSIIVGISVAIASRRVTGINMPLVLDDVFYASDFENRATIEKFIHSLFDIYEKFTRNLPLQLILFTHDELIFESAMMATPEYQIDKINFAKLFPFKDAEKEGDFLNLIYKLPQYLPQKLYEKEYEETM
ncbi:MAG: hypothetical protein EPN82_04185 [Bacteroidetes bacterium]|nr:MAG: hypothetical protein EPN82_04185 [Bacteroidota bacterium]